MLETFAVAIALIVAWLVLGRKLVIEREHESCGVCIAYGDPRVQQHGPSGMSPRQLARLEQFPETRRRVFPAGWPDR